MTKKETTVYVCDICKKSYLDKDLAEKCEASHMGINSIKELKYSDHHRGGVDFAINYPDKIAITFNDATVKYYTASKER